MVHYRLSYFPIRGRGEPIKLLFHYAGVPYEEHTIPRSEWPKIKPTLIFKELPVMEVDGRVIGQTLAISRFLARRFGLAGADEFEAAECDMYADGVHDFLPKISPLRRACVSGDQERIKEELAKLKAEAALPEFLTTYEAFLEKNGSGWFVGNKVNWIDFLVAEWLDRMVDVDATLLKDITRVYAIPQIKKRVEERQWPKGAF